MFKDNDANSPVSEEALASCAETLERIWASNRGKGSVPAEGDFLLSKRCRRLRSVISSYANWMQARKFGGCASRMKYEEKRAIRRKAQGERKRAKDMDRRHINTTRLRMQRIKSLKRLTESNDLPLIADGFESEHVAAIRDAASADERDAPGVLLHRPRSCYICKARFTKLHDFYDQLCPACARLNFERRTQTADMRGCVALVTGGRVKIGFCVALKLLRWGARVVVTTRFPADAAKRYAREKDFDVFADRLDIVGLDFRDIAGLDRFCSWFGTTHERLDVLINNACQTVRRPPQWYAHLLKGESAATPKRLRPLLEKDRRMRHDREASAAIVSKRRETAADLLSSRALRSFEKSQIAMTATDSAVDGSVMPEGRLDRNLQQIDLRRENSWTTKIDAVEPVEVAECFAINTIAPFVLTSKLIPLLRTTSAAHGADTFVVNVSAMEGKFYRHKTPNHPHTNAAKAALNMLTRTSSADLAKRGVLMTSVDTGWINDENPLHKARAHADKHNFQTPIDEIDAAARILDPVVARKVRGRRLFGIFLKDYHETEW